MNDADRPPYASFEMRAVEDRDLTVKRGMYMTKDVAFAVIIPPGSKDRVERKAEEWIADLELRVSEDRFKPEWLSQIKARYTEWINHREAPIDGTAIGNWPILSPSQRKACETYNIRTVEELANLSEEGMANLGMGSRALKDQAKSWLIAANDIGKVASRLAAVEVQMKTMQAEIAAKDERLSKFEALYGPLQTPIETDKPSTNIEKSEDD